MTVVSRGIPVVLGLALYVGLAGEGVPWRQWWFYVGLGIAVSRVFVEPFFTRPQDAVANSIAAIAAIGAAQREAVGALWDGVLGVSLAVLLSSLVAAAWQQDSSWKRFFYQVGTRLGSYRVLGALILITEAIRRARLDQEVVYFSAGSALLMLGLWRWEEVLQFPQRPIDQEVLAALGPRVVLVQGMESALRPGERAIIEGEIGQCKGTVLKRLPHHDGTRYEVALDDEWSSIGQEFPTRVSVSKDQKVVDIVGVVGEGSTDLMLSLEPTQQLNVGEPLQLIGEEGGALLYQVTSLEIRQSAWEGSRTLQSVARCRQIGEVGVDRLRLRPYLPYAHRAVRRVSDVRARLPEGFCEVGKVQGTGVPIGIDTRIDGRRHIAILGMSGMGKTSVANRLGRALGDGSVVVAMDVTGEYRSRLGLPEWDEDWTAPGYAVYEPAGEPATRARELVQGCMDIAAEEYGSGTPLPRVVLMEEAHSFVPEWNFCTPSQRDQVNFTTRMVMQARKFRVAVVIVSQRTAVVSKSAISQCEDYIVLRTIDQTSLDYMEAIVGREMREAIPRLGRFEGVCVGPGFNSDGPVVVSLATPRGSEGSM